MRNKGPLLLLALLLPVFAGACEGDERKEAFASYEQKVDPLLEKEARLRARFEDEANDAFAYRGGGGELADLVKNRLVPFYGEMAKGVAAIEPEGTELARIHSLLARYVDLRRQFFTGYLAMGRQAEATSKAIRPYALEVDAARSGVANTAQKLQSLLPKAPADLQQRLAALLQPEQNYQRQIWTMEQAVEQGLLSGADFRRVVEEKVRPRYDELAKTFDGMEVGAEGEALLQAAKSWVSAMQKALDASLKLADAAPASDANASPERLQSLQQEAAETLAAFKDEAKKYRNSLN